MNSNQDQALLANTINTTLDKIGAKGFERFRLFFDILYCRKVLHFTDEEYLAYKLYNLKNRYRKQFMLVYHQRNFMQYFNKPGFTLRKYQFYQRIPQFFQRDMILAPACGVGEFLQFVKSHGVVVIKPDAGSYGKDIEKYEYTNDGDAINFFWNIKQNLICEEYVVQHDAMNQMNPSSVNTIRVVSLRKDNEIVITSASLRAAVTGSFSDNMRQGGLGAQVDIATGILCTHGADYSGNHYQKHPVSGCAILGFQIPHWDKAVDLVKNAHAAITECDYLGWDIAITPTGADIIEANTAPGPMLTQFLDGVPKGTLVLPILKARRKAGTGANGMSVMSPRERKKIKKKKEKEKKKASQK